MRAVSDLRVVVTHDFAETYGGAERVTQELAASFPNGPVVALLGRPEVASRMGVADRFRSVLPPRTRLLRHYRPLAPAFPARARAARLPEADVLISSSYGFAHHFSAPPGALHVCYCHSPLRFAWSMTEEYGDIWANGPLTGAAFGALAAAMRRVDRRGAQTVDAYLTQADFVADLIGRCYGRRAEVIGAPVDCELFRPDGEPDDYFLLCGRLVEPYKRATVVVDAFRRLPSRLVVAGDGPALPELRRMASPNVEFVGHLEDAELVEAMQRCRAVLFPSRDDFGLIPLEVMACGRPVLAYAAGGALSTVRAGVTGEFFAEQTPAAVEQAVRAFEPERYDPGEIRRHAERWDRMEFRRRVVAAVERAHEAAR